MRRRSAVAAVALALAACGGSPSGLTPVEQNQLLGMISQARAQLTAGDPGGALGTLTTLRERVSALRRQGVLDPARAAHIQSVAAQAQGAARAQIAAAVKPAAPGAATGPPAATTTPGPPNNPAQVIVQDAQALEQRAQRAVDKSAEKLKQKLDKLRGGFQGGGGGGD